MHESNRSPSVSTDSLCLCPTFEAIVSMLCKSNDASVTVLDRLCREDFLQWLLHIGNHVLLPLDFQRGLGKE